MVGYSLYILDLRQGHSVKDVQELSSQSNDTGNQLFALTVINQHGPEIKHMCNLL